MMEISLNRLACNESIYIRKLNFFVQKQEWERTYLIIHQIEPWASEEPLAHTISEEEEEVR